MGKLLPTILDTKFQRILAHERSLAKRVASSVIEPRPVGVWEFMIPILFLLNMFQYKRTKEVFSLNFLFTKKLALEGALDMIKENLSPDEVMARIKRKTGELLTSDAKGIYSQKIRQKQLKEIEFLLEHYRMLLQAEGKDYASMARNAYPSRQDYDTFLEQLKIIERGVNRAAQQQVRTTGAPDIVSKMEAAAESRRRTIAQEIFGSLSTRQDA